MINCKMYIQRKAAEERKTQKKIVFKKIEKNHAYQNIDFYYLLVIMIFIKKLFVIDLY